MNAFRKLGNRRAMVVGSVLLAAGCAYAEPLRPVEELDPRVLVYEQPVHTGLIQIVRVSPARPVPGDTLQIVSVVLNRGTTAVVVSSRICGLDLQTELELRDPFGRCAAYSQRGALAPDDSVRAQESKIVLSRPGSYTLRLRHLLEPEQWITIPLEVRPR